MTSKVNGKTGNLTPCRSETLENFITKTGNIDYVAWNNMHAKFYGNWSRGVRPTNSWNITSFDVVYLSFPSLVFPFLSFFLVLAYSKNGWTYLVDQYIKRRVFSQGCVFWRWENLNLIFKWLIWRKKSKKLQWGLWGNFKKILNCHNSGCTKDRVVNFGSMVWFWGRSI